MAFSYRQGQYKRYSLVISVCWQVIFISAFHGPRVDSQVAVVPLSTDNNNAPIITTRIGENPRFYPTYNYTKSTANPPSNYGNETGGAAGNPDRIQTVTGLLFEEIPGPVLYESLIPIVYTVNIPSIVLKGGNSTGGENFIQNLFVLHESEDSGEDSMAIPRFPCNKLLPHFTSFLTTPTGFERYLNSLRKCSQKQLITENFRSIESPGQGEGQISIQIPNKSKYAGSGNDRESTGKTEAIRDFNDALESCRAHLIPASLISLSTLYSSLVAAEQKLAEKNSQLAIPLSLSTYYRKKVADCIFLTNGTLAIRLLIPTLKMDAELILRRYHTVPFLKRDQGGLSVCKLANIAPYYIEDYRYASDPNPWKSFLEDDESPTGTSALIETSCTEFSDLCQVLEMSERSSNKVASSPCLAAVMKNAEDFGAGHGDNRDVYYTEIEESCPMQCERVDEPSHLNLNAVQRKGANVFSVLGDSSSVGLGSVRIQCSPSKERRSLEIRENSTLIVSLPCNCKLKYRGNVFRPRFPCDPEENVGGGLEKVVVSHVQPVHWRQSQGQSEGQIQGQRSPTRILSPEEGAANTSPATVSSGENSGTNNNNSGLPSMVEIVYRKQRNYDRKLKDLTQSVQYLKNLGDGNGSEDGKDFGLFGSAKFNCSEPANLNPVNFRNFDPDLALGHLIFCSMGVRAFIWTVIIFFMATSLLLLYLLCQVWSLNKWRKMDQLFSLSNNWGHKMSMK